jgi:hypothetical protein
MSDVNAVRAAPRPLLELLSQPFLALIEPAAPRPLRSACTGDPDTRYASFDVPTYLRRRLKIAGLDGEALPVPEGGELRVRAGSMRPPSPPRA